MPLRGIECVGHPKSTCIIYEHLRREQMQQGSRSEPLSVTPHDSVGLLHTSPYPHCRSRRERLSHPARQCAETLHRLAESGRQRGSRSEPLSVAPHDSVGLPHTHILLPTAALGESDSHTQHDSAQPPHSTQRLIPLIIPSLHISHRHMYILRVALSESTLLRLYHRLTPHSAPLYAGLLRGAPYGSVLPPVL